MFFESFLLNLSVLVVLIAALTFDYITKFFSYWYVRHVPYKPSIPFFGSDYHRVLGFTNSTNEVNKLYNQYSKDKFVGRVKSRIPDLIVKDPDAIKRMLSTDFAYFRSRGLGLDKSRDVCIRNNLFYADGEKWNLLRQGLEPVLNNMRCEFDLHQCLPETNGDTNVQQLLSDVLDGIFQNLLMNSEETQSLKELTTSLQKRTIVEKLKTYLKNIFPSVYVILGLTTLTDQEIKSTCKYLHNSKLQKLISDSGFMHQISLKDKHKNVSENEFAISNLALFVTEGYIPCLNLLTALLYELAVNPQIQEKARDATSKDNGDYLDAAIKEALRLHPPYSIISRQCVKMYQYPDSNMTIDKKVTINVPIEALHKDKEHYEEPEVFNPDRFLDETSSSKYCYTYLPFGAGPRKCIGEQLSLQIIKGVTKTILQKYDMQSCNRTPKKLAVADHDFGRVIDKTVWLNFKERN